MKQKTISRLALCALMCLSATNGRAQILTISSGAFQGCSSLKSVDIPSTVTLGSTVFDGCTSLTTFWAKSLSSYGSQVFRNCKNIEFIGVDGYYKDPNGPNYLAKDGTLKEGSVNAVIGSDITTIGDYAFSGRGVKKINIPATVTKMVEYAFENCTELEALQVNWDLPLSVPNTTFSGVDCSNVTLYCPEDVEDFYSMTSVWMDFYVKAGEMENTRSYYAELGSACYSTTYFPVSVTVPEDVKAYYISGVDNNSTSLVLNELSTIPANTGVLLHASAGMHIFQAANSEVDALTDNKLVTIAPGSRIAASNATESNYILQKQDQVAFYKVTSARFTEKPGAYLQIPTTATSARILTFEDDEAVTAIKTLTTEGKEAEIYDLSGRRLNQLQKGINIVNGVKILVK